MQTDTSLLADGFENLETHALKYTDLIILISYLQPGLVWQARLKKANVNLELLTDVDMLLKNEAGIEVEYASQKIEMLKQIIST